MLDWVCNMRRVVKNMPVEGVQNKHKSHIGLLATTTAAGALAGGVIGANHMPEKVFESFINSSMSIDEFTSQMRDIFDKKQAKMALQGNQITKEDFDMINETSEGFEPILRESKNLIEAFKTGGRKKIFSAYCDLRKACFIAKDNMLQIFSTIGEKLDKYNIFKEKIAEEIVNKIIVPYKAAEKIAVKHIAVNTAIGSVVGLAVGLGVKHLLNDDKS